jgi:multiple sugar transport system permease protein
MKTRVTNWIAPTMIILFVVELIPFIICLGYSFRDISYTSLGSIGQWIGLDNYREALFDPDFLHSLGITFKFMIPAVLIELILGLLVALLFAKSNLKGVEKLIPILIIPTIIAPVVVGLIGNLALNSEYGVLGVFLHKVGLVKTSVLGSSLALPAITLLDIWEWTPFVMVILLAGLLSLPKDPYEAAAVDGATPWQTFKNITFPMITPLFAIVALLRSIEAFKIFDTAWIMTRGGPGQTTETSNIYAYRINFMHWRLGYGAAVVMLLYIVSFLLCVIFWRYLNREQIKKEREVIFYGDGGKEN